MILFDRKGRKHTEPACERATQIGELTPERKKMFLAVAKDLDERAPDTTPTETDNDDCMKCGWPVDEHARGEN
jgi:hypothetical protein